VARVIAEDLRRLTVGSFERRPVDGCQGVAVSEAARALALAGIDIGG